MKTYPKVVRPYVRPARLPGKNLGFTLLEVLIVIALIATLAALMTPALKSARDKANAAQCASNMKQFGMAFAMYADAFNGWLPHNYIDNSYNWQSMLVDSAQGGNFMGQNNSGRSIIPSWTPPCIRVTTKLLCPTTVRNCMTAPNGTVISLTDPHEQWGYSYNHCRGTISWQAWDAPGNVWPWDTDGGGAAMYKGVDTRGLYQSPSKAIILVDGNGANYNPDDWDATTGDLPSYNTPIIPVHTGGVNALFMDGHVSFMNLLTAADKTAFNRAFYCGIPIPGNPYRND